MAIIALEGMRFFAFHGVYEHERLEGNHFECDVWLDTGELPLPETDLLDDTLDYGLVHDTVAAHMAVPKQLLESLVGGIGRQLVAQFPQVKELTVRVSKENPPVAGTCRRSYVEARFRP